MAERLVGTEQASGYRRGKLPDGLALKLIEAGGPFRKRVLSPRIRLVLRRATGLRREPPSDLLVCCRLTEQVKVVHVVTDPLPGFTE